MSVQLSETERATALREAETAAEALFDEVVSLGLIRPGVGERELSDQIRDLAADRFGISRFWHKRIVRAGVNTLEPYRANPEDRVLGEDEILFLDFGPLLERWEADFGRTYVLGDDPAKHRLAADLPRLWDLGKAHFDTTPDITGAQLYEYVLSEIHAAGWGHGATHAGHQVGEFPHERVEKAQENEYIAPGSDRPMRRSVDGVGVHWILEVHLVDTERNFGGFFEQLLDI